MKMISKFKDGGILTINEDRKRFHFLAIQEDARQLLKDTTKIIKKMQKQGYEFVPFENCCEPGDEMEIHHTNGTIEKRGIADIGFGETSEHSKMLNK